MNQKVLSKLLALKQRDEEMRARLVKEGTLFKGYAQEMEEVHLQNAKALQEIIDQHGWPGISLVGEDGVRAAWLVAQHAISNPAFQRRCLNLIKAAVKRGDVPPQQEALLTDRTRFNERKPQVYGTIFDWDENGEMSPWIVEDPESVEKRRAEVGLDSLEESIRQMREQTLKEGNKPPESYEARQREIEVWSTKVGWISCSGSD